jgi:FkbM family methyltransferase
MPLLARQLIWRTGRKLYMYARKDQPNEMSTNGELRLQRLVSSNTRAGAKLIAFDVGARIGDWSKALIGAASGRSGGIELHVFEPVPESRAKLQEALAGPIRSGDIRVNGIALSNESKTVQIYVPHFTGGTSTLHPDSAVNYEQVLDVETSTVDRYIAENSIDHVDLLKIDTEGNDFRVLHGAMDSLRNGKIGVVQFEYNHRWIHARSYLKDVFDLVQATPYRIAKVCSTALEIYTNWHPELERFFETNYALVHERLIVPLGCDILRIGADNVCERAAEFNGAISAALPARNA